MRKGEVRAMTQSRTKAVLKGTSLYVWTHSNMAQHAQQTLTRLLHDPTCSILPNTTQHSTRSLYRELRPLIYHSIYHSDPPAYSLTSPGTPDMPQYVLTCRAMAQTCMAHPDLVQHILTWMQRQFDMTSMCPTDETQIGLKTGPINVTDVDQV